MQTRAISRGTTLPPPCSSSRVTSPVTWSGAPLFIYTRASKWGPTWACLGVSDTTADQSGGFLWKTDKLVSKDDLFSLILSAIQALRSVLNAFCVVNRKNMFVYQERTTKSVFYLRWVRTLLFFILVIDLHELFSGWCWYLRSGVNTRASCFQHQGCGFNSQGVHELIACLIWVESKPLWIKTISKCININANVNLHYRSKVWSW